VTPGAPLARRARDGSLLVIWLWGPVVAYMAVIFGLSATSSPPMPSMVSDKVVHALVYGGLALVALRASAGGRLTGITRVTSVAAWVIATVYGASDEYHQSFVPGRSAEIADLVADALGAALATGLAAASGIIARSRGARRRASGTLMS
jgi:VanZ family protein